MKNSTKILTALVVMMFFAIAPLASAGDGTYNDPFTVLYVGYIYENGLYIDMVGGDVALSEVISNVSINEDIVYYKTAYTSINYDVFFFPTSESLDNSSKAVEEGTYDYLIVDMAFTDFSYDTVGGVAGPIDTARGHFYNVTNASTIINKASIYSDNGSASFAPSSFAFRDQLGFSPLPHTTFATRMDDGLAAIGFGSTLADYERLLSDLN